MQGPPYVQCRAVRSVQGRMLNAGLYVQCRALRSEKGRTFKAGRARLRPIRLRPACLFELGPFDLGQWGLFFELGQKNLIEIFSTLANPPPAGDAFTQTRLMPTFGVAARFPTKHRLPKAGDVRLEGRRTFNAELYVQCKACLLGRRAEGPKVGVSVFRCFGV